MIMTAHSNAGFNDETKARIRAGDHIFISGNEPIPCWNGPILTLVIVMKYILSSVAEAEIGDLFLTAK